MQDPQLALFFPTHSLIPFLFFPLFRPSLALPPKSLRKPVQIPRHNNNNRMYNPQQNININISYNLSQNKQKGPPGKRITKIQKPSYSSGPCDIQIKLKSKMAEDLKKSTEHRLSNDNKKAHRKKGSNVVGRNTFTPDLFNDRRVRTQGPSAEHPDNLGTVKKVKQHSKSIQPAQQKVGISAKRIGTNKTSKSLKNGHVNSFTLINAKKHPLELSETTGIKKRRAQSQTSFAKNDKVVSKLLNMSLLASELGGSRPITSQRRCLESHSKTFKEYLSSIDVRILKTMSDDVPIFTKRMNSHEEVVKNIMRSKRISLEELTRKVVVIQRAWKRAMKNLIIKKYRLLFQQATDKLIKEPSHQISAFAAESIISDLFHPDSQSKQILSSTPLSQSQQSSNSNSLRSSSLHDKSNSYQLKWIEQNNQSQEQSQREKLNLTKYRELVMGQISRNKQRRVNANHGDQGQQWNNLNKKLNVLMNDRKQFDPSTLLDDFIEQSNYNKEWIENQFEPSSRKESQLSSEEKPADNAEALSSNQRFIREQKERNQEDSLDESQGYDHIKYGSPEEQHEILQKKMRELDRNRRRQRPHHQLSNRSESEGSEQKWINPSIMEDNVVRGYLDCGLDDFGLNLNHKIIAIDDKQEVGDAEVDHQNEYNISSDQAIGAKFQEANRGIIRKGHQELDSQPASFKLCVKEKQVDQIVQTTVQNLISQFAIDISSILKKSTQAPPQPQPQRRLVQSRPPGLATNFNSIKEYISKFLEFIDRKEQNYSKILVTINKDIGPTSLEILSYLRPQEIIDENTCLSIDQQGLFVIPTDIFQQFQNELEEQYKVEHQKQMGPRLRAYTNFWQRCIFQSFNECLDYERPYGIEGKPYDWATETKIFRKVKRSDLKKRFKKAEERLFELTLMVGGIIFEKPDSPFANTDFSLQDRHRINEERLSRILATELLQSQQSWINYNDEMAELLVELARMIEDKIFFEFVAEMKRLQRRRKIIIEETGEGTLYNL